MKTLAIALTAVLAVGLVHAFEPAKWQDSGIKTTDSTPVKKGKLLLAKKKDHSKSAAPKKSAKK